MLTQPGNGVTQGIFQAVIEAIEVGMSFLVSIDQAIALGNRLTKAGEHRTRIHRVIHVAHSTVAEGPIVDLCSA